MDIYPKRCQDTTKTCSSKTKGDHVVFDELLGDCNKIVGMAASEGDQGVS